MHAQYGMLHYSYDVANPRAMPTDCSLCNKPILITEEFIRLLDCQHLYHRLCLIRRVVEASQKRFFMTRRE